jgi:hypothetical protein
LIATKATLFAKGFDCVTTLSNASARALRAEGFDFACRYLGGITQGELADILAAGLAFMPVTYSRAPGWTPTSVQGTADGSLDVTRLEELGIPKETTVWLDLEGTSGGDPAGFVDSWAVQIAHAGFTPGLYVGDACGLDPSELYSLGVHAYWHSISEVPEHAAGWQMFQLCPGNRVIADVEVDVDVIQADRLGRVPTWVVA